MDDLADIDTDNLNNNTKPNYLFNYISLEDVDYGVLKNYSEQLFSSAPSRARRVIENDSVIISTVRPNLKGFAYIKEVPPNSVFSTGFATLKSIDNEKYLTKLLYYYFAFSTDLMEQMIAKMPKALYPNITDKDIRTFKIPDIYLVEQKKIVAAIEKHEAIISEAEAQLATAAERKAAVLRKYL